MESNPNQCPFTLDDAFFPAAHGGKRFLNCVWVRLLPMGPRDHMQERSYLTRSLYCPWGERKTLRVWVRLLSMGPKVCILDRTISCQLWMGGSPNWSKWQCGIFAIKLQYVRFYSLGNYIVSAHRLWYIVSWYYFVKFCVSSFNHSCYIIIENDIAVFSQQFPKLKHVL